MKGFNIGLGIVVASFAFATAPAFAQPRDTGGGPQAAGAVDRASGGGGTPSSGGAVDRGSGGGGGSVSSAGGGGSSSSSSGSVGSSSDFARSSPSAVSSPSISMGDRGAREFAPRHREGFTAGNSGFSFRDDSAQATPRSSGPSGGGGGGGTAVTRGGGTSSSGSSGSSGGGSSASGSSDGARTPSRTRTGLAPEVNASSPNNASGAREVPSWSRPRGDRPTSGTAVERTVPPPDRNGGYGGGRYGYYDPFYGYGYGGYYGYGFGLGYGCGLSCAYYPYGFGMGYGLYSGFPYYGDAFGDPYGGMSGGGYTSSSYGRGEQGNLKLKVKPRSAKVYVDGYFVGYVDQFDGSFQKLALNTGRHKVEVKAEGYETAEFDVLINPEQTVTFQGDLKRIQ